MVYNNKMIILGIKNINRKGRERVFMKTDMIGQTISNSDNFLQLFFVRCASALSTRIKNLSQINNKIIL